MRVRPVSLRSHGELSGDCYITTVNRSRVPSSTTRARDMRNSPMTANIDSYCIPIAVGREGEPIGGDLTGHFGPLRGRSAAMLDLYHHIQRVAPTSVAVLLAGETGTGKEVVARAIHDLGERRGR